MANLSSFYTTSPLVTANVVSTLTANNATFAYGKAENALSVNNAVYLGGLAANTYAPLASPTFTGTATANNLNVAGQARQSIVAVGALDIDCSTGNYFTKTISANSTFTFSNAPSSAAYTFALELTHTSGTVTWPTAVKWPKDTAPTLTTGKTHIFVFVTDDAGTRWRGAALVDYVN